MDVQTEFEFTLPTGYIDGDGQLHRRGRMRLAQAYDEIEAAEHPTVRERPAYLPTLLLARVIVQLGTLESVTPQVVTRLFASDLAYLEDLYLRLNGTSHVVVGAVCPHCDQQFRLQVAPLS